MICHVSLNVQLEPGLENIELNPAQHDDGIIGVLLPNDYKHVNSYFCIFFNLISVIITGL